MITYAGVATFLLAKFGTSYAGLGTVGYAIKYPNGSVYQARTTTGVVELGNGDYGVNYTTSSLFSGYIEWDTGGTSPVYAREEVLVVGTPSISVVAPAGTSADGSTVTIIRGDDYKTADGRALAWVNATGSWPNLTGATIQFTLQIGGVAVTKTGAVDVASGAGQKVHADLLAADTATAKAGTYTYDVQATLSNGDKVTLALGAAQILMDYTP